MRNRIPNPLAEDLRWREDEKRGGEVNDAEIEVILYQNGWESELQIPASSANLSCREQ